MKRFIIITITALFSVLVLYLGDKTDILSTSKLESYVKKFNKSDNELYPQHISNISTLEFLSENIPLIELPNKELEETYYFRWWTFRKHIKSTEDGFVITEFLP